MQLSHMLASPPFDSEAEALRVPLACELGAEQVLLALRDEPLPFALTGSWIDGGAVVGSRPLRVASDGDDPFELLGRLPAVDGPGGSGPPFVGGGWFGWLGYGLSTRLEQVPRTGSRPVPLPPFQLAYYDNLLHQDSWGRWWFEALVVPAHRAAIEARLEWLRHRLRHPPPPPEFTPPPPFSVVAPGPVGHIDAVGACRERIAAGEIFQANVCLRLESGWRGDLAGLFARGVRRLRPAYGAAFPTRWGGIASFSPELFLRRRGTDVETRPIKGTVARGEDSAGQHARSALLASAKDHAEHVMIVDLMRNDLGRVCTFGSIYACSTPEAEPHPGLWHLVSSVRGTLRPDVGDADLLRATFPPGSITGAPKVQALKVIDALESTAREAYTGAIGFASPTAGLTLNVAIRTFEARDGRLWLGAGGGIVFDSDPERELEECFAKATPLVNAIGSSIADWR
jgi:para-aminobenzoate synthetase / 4-amino-4-deoxychorismate lyase